MTCWPNQAWVNVQQGNGPCRTPASSRRTLFPFPEAHLPSVLTSTRPILEHTSNTTNPKPACTRPPVLILILSQARKSIFAPTEPQAPTVSASMSTHLNPPPYRTSSATDTRIVEHEDDLAPYSSAENAKSRRASLEFPPVTLTGGPVRSDLDLMRTEQRQREPDRSEQPKLGTSRLEPGRIDPTDIEQRVRSLQSPHRLYLAAHTSTPCD
nr:hypothetical protein CFP56_20985 [Quercus suber]